MYRTRNTPLAALALTALLAACAGAPPESLGLRDGQLAPCPASPNCVRSGAADAEHRVAGFRLREPGPAAWTGVRQVVASLPRTRVVEADGPYLHAESSSAVFRFVDDLELHWPGGPEVAVRSASRLGHSDLGVNRKRVEALRALLLERGLLAAPGA